MKTALYATMYTLIACVALAGLACGILAVDTQNRSFTQADREIIAHQRTVMANRYCGVE